MNIRTLLIDGNFLLKRSFHGSKDCYTKSFGFFGGVYGTLTMIRKLINLYQPKKIVIAWDGENGGIKRYLIDTAYKANRKNKKWSKKIELTEAQIKIEQEKDESILKNRKRIQAYAEELFIRQIEVDDIEGDDLIAQYCIDYNNKEEIFIYTNDRDFSQLLYLNISIIFANIDEVINKVTYPTHFKHHYTNALAMKIICGDSSDNIKGISGIQEDTLLKHFPELKNETLTVRDICRKADEINKERVLNKKKPLKALESLLNNIDRLKINHKLINLSEPLLNEEAIEELNQLEMPLSPDDRGSKNLYKMMIEDEFLTVYMGTFVDYIEPFYTVIMNEKKILMEYYNKKT